MKILLLSRYNPYAETGASSNRFRGLIDGLRSAGHTVDLTVVGGYISADEKRSSPGDAVYLSRANHHSYWKSRVNTYLLDCLHHKSVCRRLKRMNLSSYDLVWLTSSYSVLEIYLDVVLPPSVRTFIELNEFYDVFTESSHTGNFLQLYQGKMFAECFEKVIGSIDYFAVMTLTLIDFYRKMAKPEAEFLHLPMTVDLKRFEKVGDSVPYDKPYIAFTGSMMNKKDGVDILIRAFAVISDRYPDVNLYLAGFWYYDVPDQDKMIRQFGLESRVHRLGVLSREQIPQFICNASVLALSRPDSHQARGGFPTKLGEYLATGNPVCVTKVGEIPDYLEDNVSAFMAEPGDADSFASALDRALSDRQNAIFVGMNGKKVAQTVFNAEIQSVRLARFLETNIVSR